MSRAPIPSHRRVSSTTIRTPGRSGRDGKILFDLQATWQVNDTLGVVFGGLKVFGETPDRAEFEVCRGRIYRSDSMIPWQGAYYYLRLGADTWPDTANDLCWPTIPHIWPSSQACESYQNVRKSHSIDRVTLFH